MTAYRPPRDCPVCSSRLQVTQLGCPHCGTGLSGSFEPCEFCGLDTADRDLLRVFLASRGNMKELERHLGVSYPTARARFEDLLRKLGLPPTSPSTSPATSASPATSPSAVPDSKLDVLRAVASGAVDVTTARSKLDPKPPTPR